MKDFKQNNKMDVLVNTIRTLAMDAKTGQRDQPVEPLASLRAIPGLITLRPTDRNGGSLACDHAVPP